MRIFFQPLVTMPRQHFSVGINIDTGPLALRKQHLQIMKIMSGNNDKRPCLQRHRYGMRRWVTVNGCVCLVQFLHDLQCHSSCLHRQLDQFFHRQLIVGDCRQSLNIKIIHRITVISQFPCLVSIGTDPFQTIDHQLTKRTDIFIQILVIHNTGNL